MFREIREVKKSEKITDQQPVVLGYTQIKPEGIMTYEEACDFINSLFEI